jgi:hypothetical protein
MHFIKQAEYTEANLSLHHNITSCNMGGDHIRDDGEGYQARDDGEGYQARDDGDVGQARDDIRAPAKSSLHTSQRS